MEEPPSINQAERYDKSLIKFISSCLIKDVSKRPDIETLIKMNKEFFDHAKDKDYLKKNLIKNLPSIIDRVNIFIILKSMLEF